ncbi:hypothetical protein [Sphingomonas aracearum]|uniref:Uncharacterized protein n=1 Tax=Sphingomonas aracearum TaxID=2283317 RepID=A0A369VXB9_9SPHN|nr:hypothetical protein [Sphingomonas aracearum]RDE07026.1 hypothetical protein DVW87_05040 [Sphingomonas aracearum]
MPFSRLFRSRWAALIWAAGILWTAYDVASNMPDKPQNKAAANGSVAAESDATGEAVNAADLAVLANAMGAQ